MQGVPAVRAAWLERQLLWQGIPRMLSFGKTWGSGCSVVHPHPGMRWIKPCLCISGTCRDVVLMTGLWGGGGSRVLCYPQQWQLFAGAAFYSTSLLGLAHTQSLGHDGNFQECRKHIKEHLSKLGNDKWTNSSVVFRGFPPVLPSCKCRFTQKNPMHILKPHIPL